MARARAWRWAMPDSSHTPRRKLRKGALLFFLYISMVVVWVEENLCTDGCLIEEPRFSMIIIAVGCKY